MQAHASLTLCQAKNDKSPSRPDAIVQDESGVLSQCWQFRGHVYQ